MNLLTIVFLIYLVQHTWQTTFAYKRTIPNDKFYGHDMICTHPMGTSHGTSKPYDDEMAPHDVIQQNYGLDDRPGDAPRQTKKKRKVLVLISKKLYNKMAKKEFEKQKSGGKSNLFIPMKAYHNKQIVPQIIGAEVLYNNIKK